jgi:metal-responsive CopG/Arc/MetJ family transcriptional regulator
MMKELMSMRTTLNLSEQLVKEVESLYGTGNRSKAVEKALEEAVRLKKLKAFMNLKGRVAIDKEAVQKIREAELLENEDNR